MHSDWSHKICDWCWSWSKKTLDFGWSICNELKVEAEALFNDGRTMRLASIVLHSIYDSIVRRERSVLIINTLSKKNYFHEQKRITRAILLTIERFRKASNECSQ